MTDTFLLAHCPQCDVEVLLAYDLVLDELVTRCVLCDALIDSELGRPASAEDVAAAGYTFEGEADPHGSRGCRDGQCGVRQPDR